MGTRNMIKAWVTGGALALALACPLPAAATDILKPTGYVIGSQVFDVTGANNVNAGAFRGLLNGQGIRFFCIELNQYFSFGNTYRDYTISKPEDFRFARITELFGSFGNVAFSSTLNSAAFQLAVWELIYENPASGYDLDTGAFQVTDDHNHAATVALANAWLESLGSPSATQHGIRLHSQTHQDFILLPEPATLALLTLGLLLIVALRRRQAQRR